MKYVNITNLSRPNEQNLRVYYCASFLCRFRGLMFINNFNDFEGLLLVETGESRLSTTIHMFFMKMDIAAIWINKNFIVVDKALAYRWKPYYSSSRPAQYILETYPDRYNDFQIGDQLVFNAE
jgi:uncharacterized membrane protein (UPF0127 family)